MPTISDEAIVVRLTDYSETSQIAWLFSNTHGLVRVIAKGSKKGTKKRFATGLDLLELGDVSYKPPKGDAELATLTEWVQRDAFSGIRKTLLGLYASLYAAELTATLTLDRDPHPRLFRILKAFLTRISDGVSVASIIGKFQYALLEEIGYQPVLDRCTDCGQVPSARRGLFFSSQAGGLVCRDCEMTHVEKTAFPVTLFGVKPGEGDVFAWFTLFEYHCRNIIGRPLRSSKQLTQELARSIGKK